MSNKLSRRQRRQQNMKAMQRQAETFQIREVQGPQRYDKEPQTARVQLNADLTEKYLGAGMVGFGPSLEVLSNRSADELICAHGYDLYRKMLMDSEVDASIDLLIQSSDSLLVAVPPIDVNDPGYETSKQLADFVNYVLARLNIDDWRKEQTRAMLAFGHSVSEIDWDFKESGEWANHMVISCLRQQRPEDYGFIVDRWGEIYGVAPLNQALGFTFPLGNLIPLSEWNISRELKGAVPRYKLTVWTWEKKYNDPRGTSALIPAYIPWWSKQRAIEEWSCWLGRYAQPSIWATPGPDAVPICITMPDGSQIITQPTEALLQALLKFKSASVLALPYGSDLNVIEAKGGAEPFLDSITAFNKEITRAILGQHLASSEGDNQSRAAADVHAMILRQFVNSIRRFVARQIQRDIVVPLIQANYGDVGYLMPTVDVGEGETWQLTVTEIAVLLQAGYFTVDQLKKLDKLIGIPVRETDQPAGPAAASAYYKLQELNGSTNPEPGAQPGP